MRLVLILAVSLLAACGGGEDFDNGGPAVADTGVPRVDCAKTPKACI